MEPLLRWKPPRVAIAVAVGGGAVLVLVAAWVALVWLLAPWTFLVALVLALTAPFAAIPIWRGAWDRRIERFGAAGFLLAFLAGLALLVVRCLEEARVRDLGVPTESYLAEMLVLLGIALAGLAAILAALPVWPSRAVTAVVAVSAVLSAGTLASAATLGATTTCADVTITPQVWERARDDERNGVVTDDERVARAIVDCEVLDGATAEEVRAALGAPDGGKRRRWRWGAGWTNDGIGPGDGQELILEFDDAGRVERARLRYP